MTSMRRHFVAIVGLLLLTMTVLTAQQKTLVVAVEDANNAPWEYKNGSGEVTGFHVDLIRAVAATLNWKVEVRSLPWVRALKALEGGEVDALSYCAWSTEREAYAVFLPDNILRISRPSLFVLDGNPAKIDKSMILKDMVAKWRFGAAKGYNYGPEVMGLIGSGSPIDTPVVDQTTLFKMLASGRYDAVFGSANMLSQAVKDNPDLSGRLEPLSDFFIRGYGLYLAFSKVASSGDAAVFGNALKTFRREAAYTQLIDRYGVRDFIPRPEELR